MIMITQKEIQNIIMMIMPVNTYLGFQNSSNEDKSIKKPKAMNGKMRFKFG